MYHITTHSLTMEQIIDLTYLVEPSLTNQVICQNCRLPMKLILNISPSVQSFQYSCKCGLQPAQQDHIFNQAFQSSPVNIVPVFVKIARQKNSIGCAFYMPSTQETGKMCILNKGFDRGVTEFKTELVNKLGGRGKIAIFCDNEVFEWFADMICIKVENGDSLFNDAVEKVEVIAENASYLSGVQGWA